MMPIINRILGIGCALFVNILIHFMPDGKVRHVLIGIVLGAGFTACLNMFGENK